MASWRPPQDSREEGGSNHHILPPAPGISQGEQGQRSLEDGQWVGLRRQKFCGVGGACGWADWGVGRLRAAGPCRGAQSGTGRGWVTGTCLDLVSGAGGTGEAGALGSWVQGGRGVGQAGSRYLLGRSERLSPWGKQGGLGEAGRVWGSRYLLGPGRAEWGGGSVGTCSYIAWGQEHFLLPRERLQTGVKWLVINSPELAQSQRPWCCCKAGEGGAEGTQRCPCSALLLWGRE